MRLINVDRQNLQDAFLNQVHKEKNSVTVFLINGVKLQGVITWFDNFYILRRDGQSQLVYKHAVSTIMPSQNVSLYDGEEPIEYSCSCKTRIWVFQIEFKSDFDELAADFKQKEAVALSTTGSGSRRVASRKDFHFKPILFSVNKR